MKKKLIIIISIVILIISIVVLFIFKDKESVERINNSSVPKIVLNDVGSPIFIENSSLINTKIKDENDVYDVLNKLKNIYGFKDSKKEFNIISIEKSMDFTYYKLNQKYNSVPIYGKQLVISVDKNNNVLSITGNYYKDINVKTYSKFSLKETETNLLNKFDVEYKSIEKLGHYIYINDDNKVFNSYIITLVTNKEYSDYVINADDGSVIDIIAKRNNAAEEIDATGIDNKKYKITLNNGQGLANSYHFYDPNRNITVVDAYGISIDMGNAKDTKWINIAAYLLNKSNKNPFIAMKDKDENLHYISSLSQGYSEIDDNKIKSAVVAMYNYEKTYDYYKNVLGRNSYDNNGSPIIVNIGVQKDIISFKKDNEFVNACWRSVDSAFYFGTSNGITLAIALDVVGHEFTHAVTEKISALEYRGESGALNESYSDILGSLVEDKNFNIGEDIFEMRNMANPNQYKYPAIKDGKYYFPTDLETYNKEWQEELMKKSKENGELFEKWQDWDNGGVHTNSGVSNYAAYLMYNNGAFTSKEEMAKVWYNSQFLLTSTSDFEDASLAVLQTAKMLGLKENKIKIIEDAFIETNMLKKEYSKVSGQVIDEIDGSSLSNTKVTFISKKNIYINYITYTDNDGKYQLSDIPIGEYNVVFDKAKYTSYEENTNLILNKENTISVKLIKAENSNYKDSEIVFVLDISASMTTSDPSDIRKQIMNNVLSSLSDDTFVALITYSKNAKIINDGLNNKRIDKKMLMTDVFNIVNDSGYTDNSGTNGRTGLSKALELFKTKNKSRKYIIFFTDGCDNLTEGMSYEEIISTAKQNNIRILSIGLGNKKDIDEKQLKLLANSTNGKYYYATDASDLQEFDKNIFDELK